VTSNPVESMISIARTTVDDARKLNSFDGEK
jgi:hypothetical protein